MSLNPSSSKKSLFFQLYHDLLEFSAENTLGQEKDAVCLADWCVQGKVCTVTITRVAAADGTALYTEMCQSQL